MIPDKAIDSNLPAMRQRCVWQLAGWLRNVCAAPFWCLPIPFCFCPRSEMLDNFGIELKKVSSSGTKVPRLVSSKEGLVLQREAERPGSCVLLASFKVCDWHQTSLNCVRLPVTWHSSQLRCWRWKSLEASWSKLFGALENKVQSHSGDVELFLQSGLY